jgi:hypothetical protein
MLQAPAFVITDSAWQAGTAQISLNKFWQGKEPALGVVRLFLLMAVASGGDELVLLLLT